MIHLFQVIAAAAAISATTVDGHNITFSGTKPMQAHLRESAGPGGRIHFDMWESAQGTLVRKYDTDMTKLIHMIVVSDNLAYFDHIHPVLQADGHFTIDYRPPTGGLYHVYLDGVPHSLGRQVFRFDVPAGSATAAAARQLHAPGSAVEVGPYRISLDPTSVPSGEITTIDVSISKYGRPAADLHPYLGAMAHGVFVGLKDLAYMHAHGMSKEMLSMADSNDCGDKMMLSMPPLPPNSTIPSRFEFQILAPRAQSYDFWLQFIGDKTLYTVPFLMRAR
ncbi:MAG: hypothetical protein GIW98_01785 [Candidatus Eremiobacteraeota bacterium]|nr:hypothetical protein [Candidatus Eremiobacteraeota bacterium]